MGAVYGLGALLVLLILVALFAPSSPPPGYGYDDSPWWKPWGKKWWKGK